MVRHICWPPEVLHSFSTASLFLWHPSPSHSFISSEILWTTQTLVSGLCSMELSPDLTPSFELYISLQIRSKDASFPVPVAFSSWHCERCMDGCVGGGRERERVYVCVCRLIHRWVPPNPFVYLALRANDQVRRFINIHLHYITYEGIMMFT